MDVTSEMIARSRGKVPLFRGFLARFPRAVEAAAVVSQFGSGKYDVPLHDTTFTEMCPDWRETVAMHLESMTRHLRAAGCNEVYNETDGGVLHLAEMFWRAGAALETFLKHSGSAVLDPDGNFQEPQPEPRHNETEVTARWHSEQLPELIPGSASRRS